MSQDLQSGFHFIQPLFSHNVLHAGDQGPWITQEVMASTLIPAPPILGLDGLRESVCPLPAP